MVKTHSDQMMVNTTASFGQDASWWLNQMYDLVVISLPPDNELQVYYLEKLYRDVPKKQPLLFLTSNVTTPLIKLSIKFPKVRIMKEPVTPTALHGMLENIFRPEIPGKTAIHPRYPTDKDVHVTCGYGDKILGTMKNLSLSGAYLELFMHVDEINIGETVKLEIKIGVPAELKSYQAKIIWKKDKSSDLSLETVTGLGVCFINGEEFYNDLLKDL